MKWVLAMGIGALTGIISGCGIGGGSLLMLYLTMIADIGQKSAGGINLCYFLACAPPALIGHIRNRLIVWKTMWITVAAGAAVSVGAAIAAQYIETAWLRRGFGVLLLYIGVKELFCRKVDEKEKTPYNMSHKP